MSKYNFKLVLSLYFLGFAPSTLVYAGGPVNLGYTSPAKQDDATDIWNPQLNLEKLNQDYCLNPTPEKTEVKTEASICIDCLNAENPPDPVDKITEASQEAFAKVKEEEQIDKELAFYNYVQKFSQNTISNQSYEKEILSLGDRIKESQENADRFKNEYTYLKSIADICDKALKGAQIKNTEKKKIIDELKEEIAFRKNLKALQEQQQAQYKKSVEDIEQLSDKNTMAWALTNLLRQKEKLADIIEQQNIETKEMENLVEVIDVENGNSLTKEQKQTLQQTYNSYKERTNNSKYSMDRHQEYAQDYKVRLTKMQNTLAQKIQADESEKKIAKSLTLEQKKEKLKTYQKGYLEAYAANAVCGMTAAESLAIDLMSGPYSSIKKNNDSSHFPNTEENAPFIKVYEDAIKKIKNYEGFTFLRGVSSAELEKYQVGEKVSYNHFTSTSLNPSSYTTLKIVIKSRTGKYLTPASLKKIQQAVYFAPETQFKILSRETIDQTTQIVMEEVAPE